MFIDRPDIEPGIKIAAQVTPKPTEDEMAFMQAMGMDHITEDDLPFIKQMGVEYAALWTGGESAGYEFYRSCREMLEKEGIKLYALGNRSVHNVPAITLALPGRDVKIEEYKEHIRNLGKAGIPYTTYAHMANGIWNTARETTRGGAPTRAFDLAKAETGTWDGEIYKMPLSHGRRYSEDEIWDNFEYFIKQIAPVAEEAGVKIGIHPDDPPVPELAGIPRCIFSSFDGYKRAMEIADSPNIGLCLCVGCWLEGGDLMGKDVLETIRYFGERRKIFKVHFRSVNAPLPHFAETFLDAGYMDMYPVMRALRAVDFDGIIMPDHIPAMTDNHRVGTAFSIAYMKGLLERANSAFANAEFANAESAE